MSYTSIEILFDKFEIIETLKKDSHTSVYLANHIYLGKKIILKTLKIDEQIEKTLLDRFKREAQILAKLDHPNLIKVFDFGNFEDYFYISFEYFQSKNVRDIIRNNNLSKDEKRNLLIQLLEALHVAHQISIIHRDIKPANILVNSRMQLKIVDFGLAFALNDNNLTHKSTIVGTPSYMSPEQIRGEALSPQTDLFAAGTVALELFTSRNPFLGKNINETVNNILNFEEDSILKDTALLDEDVQKAIRSMLRKSTNKRAKTALEVLNILGVDKNSIQGLSSISDDELVKYVLKNSKITKKILAVLLPIVLILVAAGVWFYNSGMKNETAPSNAGISDSKAFFNLVSPDEGYVFYDKKLYGKAPPTIINKDNELAGRFFVDAKPWVDVYINGKKVDTTPLTNYIQLKPGKYSLKLVNPRYPAYTRRITISNDKIETFKIDFDELVGFLDCKINPWGKVYVDGEEKGTTPFREPIFLFPGTHLLKVTSTQFPDYEQKIRISARDTLQFKLNFEELNKDTQDTSQE